MLLPCTSPLLSMNVNDTLADGEYVPIIVSTSSKVTEYRHIQACFYRLLTKACPVICPRVGVYCLRTGQTTFIDTDDVEMQRRTASYIRWVRIVRNCGWVFALDPPSHPNLLPNMKITVGDPQYDRLKEDIARKVHDVTLLWKCSPRHRERVSYAPFTEIDVSDLGLGNHTQTIVQQMIRLYRSNEILHIGDDETFLNVFRIDEGTTYVYVDFELIDNKIYLIGASTFIDGVYTHHRFFAQSLHPIHILDNMTSFRDWLETLPASHVVLYWYAEQRFWNACTNAPRLSFEKWIDMCKVFQNIPILVRGCFTFKLKHVVKWMNTHGCITTVFPDECATAQQSMTIAARYFTTRDDTDYTALCTYNEVDCCAMYDIHTYLNTYLNTNVLNTYLNTDLTTPRTEDATRRRSRRCRSISVRST